MFYCLTEIRCPVLAAPDYGYMSECDNTYESVCEFDCQEGFIMERGSARRSCDESGHWTGSDVVCRRKYKIENDKVF